MQHAIDAARAHSLAFAADDPTYAELMCAYVELGEAALDGDALACAELARRVIRLGSLLEMEAEASWAAWCARSAR